MTVFRIRRQPYFRIRDWSLGWENEAENVKVVPLKSAPDAMRDRRGWREVHLDILREPLVRETASTVSAALDALDS